MDMLYPENAQDKFYISATVTSAILADWQQIYQTIQAFTFAINQSCLCYVLNRINILQCSSVRCLMATDSYSFLINWGIFTTNCICTPYNTVGHVSARV